MRAVRSMFRRLRPARRNAEQDRFRAALTELKSLDLFKTVIDVGANEGQTAAMFATLFPYAEIHCLEPDAEAFAKLLQSTARERRVHCHRIAVGEVVGELELVHNQASVTNSFLSRSPQAKGKYFYEMMKQVRSESVSVMTLPVFFRENKIKYADLIKIDTQGFEDRILRGSMGWLTPDRVGCLLLEVLFTEIYQEQADFGMVYGMLRDCGYKLHSLHNAEHIAPEGLQWADAFFIAA